MDQAHDFKGDFSVGRARCYPLSVTDSYSRFIIACIALPNTRTLAVKRALQRMFDEYGLPDAIRSDNGSPFSSRGVAGLSTLSVWWHKLGIRHERIDPGHPEQNGRHERMHRDLKRETASPPATTLAKQQRLFDLFRARFNQERPHEALEQRTPNEFYDVSSRRLPEPWWGKDFEYNMEGEALRVSKDGYVATHRGAFFLSTTLTHELVEIDWYERNRARVLFGTMNLGDIVAKPKRRQLRFTPVESVDATQPSKIAAAPPPKVSPMSLDTLPVRIRYMGDTSRRSRGVTGDKLPRTWVTRRQGASGRSGHARGGDLTNGAAQGVSRGRASRRAPFHRAVSTPRHQPQDAPPGETGSV